MKKIKKLNVHVTFSVGLGDLEVSDKVYHQLLKAEKRGLSITGDQDGIPFTDALDFLADNVSLDDAYECEYEVDVDTEED